MQLGEKEKILFVHMPKAAGQSVLQFVREGIFKGSDSNWLYIGNPDEERVFESMETGDLQRMAFLGGHVSLSAFRRKVPSLKDSHYIFTILREPFERALSLYRYIRGYPPHFMHKDILGLSFIEFLNSQFFPRNHQCYLIQKNAGSSEAIDAALQHFDLIGFYDDLNVVTTALSNQFSCNKATLPMVNKSEFAVHLSNSEEAEARDIISIVDSEDVLLYEALHATCPR